MVSAPLFMPAMVIFLLSPAMERLPLTMMTGALMVPRLTGQVMPVRGTAPVPSLAATPSVLEAFRTGGGVSWAEYGADGREGQAEQNRPIFLNLLGRVWLPQVEDIHARLNAEPPARVADVGCGAGWSSIGLAKAYPLARIDGFDLDEPSIAQARANAVDHGVAERVRAAIARRTFRFDGAELSVTVSAGVATTCGDAEVTPANLLRMADERLYAAKRSGRNRVVGSSDSGLSPGRPG